MLLALVWIAIGIPSRTMNFTTTGIRSEAFPREIKGESLFIVVKIHNRQSQTDALTDHRGQRRAEGSHLQLNDAPVLVYRSTEFGIIVTHDGRVYKYTPPTRYVTAEIIDAEIDKRVRLFYYDVEKRREFMKVLEQLGKEYGLTCEEL